MERTFQLRESGDIKEVQDHVAGHLQQKNWPESDLFSIRMALEEALVNAIKHGNQFDSKKKVDVTVAYADDQLLIEVQDEGPGFNPDDVPDPLAEENLERASGRGVFLIRHYMNEVLYHPPGNKLTMKKQRTAIKQPLVGSAH